MKNIEVLKDRLAKRQNKIQRLTVNIEKLQKKLEKIAVTEYENERSKQWDVWDAERGIEDKTKKIDELTKEVEKIEKEIAEVEHFENRNRDVPAIRQYLEVWKQKEVEYYENLFNYYLTHKKEAEENKYKSYEFSTYSKEHKYYMDKARNFWNKVAPVQPFIEGGYNGIPETLNNERVKKSVEWDAKLKYDHLIKQVEETTGEITDATGLYIGDKGEINGLIIGKEGTANVWTIGAGGYNIQRFHFRTLVQRYTK